jgi:hypothetical protein
VLGVFLKDMMIPNGKCPEKKRHLKPQRWDFGPLFEFAPECGIRLHGKQPVGGAPGWQRLMATRATSTDEKA